MRTKANSLSYFLDFSNSFVTKGGQFEDVPDLCIQPKASFLSCDLINTAKTQRKETKMPTFIDREVQKCWLKQDEVQEKSCLVSEGLGMPGLNVAGLICQSGGSLYELST